MTLWQGTYQGVNAIWLRWCTQDGRVVPTGEERARQAEQEARQAGQRAIQAEQEAERQRRENERLLARLRELGVDPIP